MTGSGGRTPPHQLGLPGIEPEPAAIAQKPDGRLKSAAGQAPPGPLFDDSRDQIDLIDAIRARTER